MSTSVVLRILADAMAYQWGMVTSAQAKGLGVSRLQLSRLASRGVLERLAFGIYRNRAVPSGEFDDIRIAWLSTEPTRLASERIPDRENGIVVASHSAARLHHIGDLWEQRHEFITSTRRQTQRKEIRFRNRRLKMEDITIIDGLPVLTLERTIADLVDDSVDLSLVSDALRDAHNKRPLNFDHLSNLLEPYADRRGFSRNDGTSLLDQLLRDARIEMHSA